MSGEIRNDVVRAVVFLLFIGLSIGSQAHAVVLPAAQARLQALQTVQSDKIIVKFKKHALEGFKALAISNAGVQVVNELEKLDMAVVELTAATKKKARGLHAVAVQNVLEDLNNSPVVEYAEVDSVLRIDALPNDPRMDELWGLHNHGQTGGTPDADIDAPEAWDMNTGSQDVVVAVIDTGVDYTHEDLQDNMWRNPGEIAGNGIDDDGNGYVDDIYGIDAYNNDGDPRDDHYHGTHCAGTIGAVGDNGIGVAGVNWHVKIMALKFLSSSGSGNTSDAIECLDYAIMMKRDYGVNLKLTSNSWGGGSFSQALKDAIEESGDAGMLFVAAAGNSSYNNDSHPHYPSSYDSDNIISVAATDNQDQKASFSNYGAVSVDLGAPGVNILSCSPGNSYRVLNGTSMATPHVAGAAALIWAGNLNYTWPEVKDIIFDNVDPTSAMAGRCVTGGRLNIKDAVIPPEPMIVGTAPAEGDLIEIGDPIRITWQSFNADDVTRVSIEFSADGGSTFSTVNPSVPNGSGGGSYFWIPPAVSSDRCLFRIADAADGDPVGATGMFMIFELHYISGHVLQSAASPVAPVVYYDGPVSGEIVTDSVSQYILNLPSGTYDMYAAADEYRSDNQTVSIPPDAANIDFEIRYPVLGGVTPTAIQEYLMPSETVETQLIISNAGDAPLEFSITSTTHRLTRTSQVVPAEQLYDMSHFVELDKNEEDTRVGLPVVDGRGGPDNFGYTWIDSNEPGGPQYVWEDIRSTGQGLTQVSNCDDCYQAVNLGFNFPFYDRQYNRIYVSSNGYITLENGSSQFSNYPLPSTSAPPGLLAGFFDDLKSSSRGDVYFKDYGDRAVVQFTNVGRYSGSGAYTYQMVLYRNGQIRYYYNSMSGMLNSATVGIQNIGRNDGFTVAYNTPYVQNGLAVEIAPVPDWLSFSPAIGVVMPGTSAEVSVTLSADGLTGGTHSGQLMISHNAQSGANPVVVPVSLEVEEVRSLQAAPQSFDFGNVLIGQPELRYLTLTNNGNAATTITDLFGNSPAFVIDEALPLVIAPWTERDVLVSFTPTAARQYSGSFVVMSDADDNSLIALFMEGRGVMGAAISVVPSSMYTYIHLQEGLVDNGFVELPLEITNSGDVDLEYSIAVRTLSAAVTVPAEEIYDESHFAQPPGNEEDGTLVDDREGNPVTDSSGGPDAYGYSWTDSDEAGGPDYAWVDISSTGQELSTVSNCNGCYQEVDLTFDMPFYGNAYNNLYVDDNGYVTLGSIYHNATNYPLPSTSAPASVIAAFWDDLDPRTNGTIYFQDFGNRAIVQYENVKKSSYSTYLTFQIILHANGTIVLNYKNLSGTLTSATVGMQNHTRRDGFTIAYNTAYLHNQMAIEISTMPDWLQVVPEVGAVLPSTTESVSVVETYRDLPAGDYRAVLAISHNDPVVINPLEIPCRLVVDRPVLVELAEFSALAQNGSVVLEWKTATEIDNAGFNLYRAESADGFYYKLNDDLIAAQGSPAQAAAYQFVDEAAQNRKTYFYKLEDVDLDGFATQHGPISATPRLLHKLLK